MRTKEEILENLANEEGYVSWPDFVCDSLDDHIMEITMKAMQEYLDEYKNSITVEKNAFSEQVKQRRKEGNRVYPAIELKKLKNPEK